jgi:hypothetical protein
MKLFELYDAQPSITKEPVCEDKKLAAAIKLCESIVDVLEGPVTDSTAMAVKKVAMDFFDDRPYSSARIAKGKAHRLSFTVGRYLSQYYRYVSINDVTPEDKQKMIELKDELMQKIQAAGIDTSKVDIRYHIGAGMYMSIRTQIEEAVAESGTNKSLSPRQLNAEIKKIANNAGWEIWNTHGDRRKDGTIRRSYYRNGWRLPAKMKNKILSDVDNLLKTSGMNATAEWRVAEKYGYGEYDKLTIIIQPEASIEEASYEGGIEFEPSPEFAGVKGVTRDTSAGIKGAQAAQHKKAGESLNNTWIKLLKQMQGMEPAAAKKLKGNLVKVAQVAKAKGFELSPPPEKVLGL